MTCIIFKAQPKAQGTVLEKGKKKKKRFGFPLLFTELVFKQAKTSMIILILFYTEAHV